MAGLKRQRVQRQTYGWTDRVYVHVGSNG